MDFLGIIEKKEELKGELEKALSRKKTRLAALKILSTQVVPKLAEKIVTVIRDGNLSMEEGEAACFALGKATNGENQENSISTFRRTMRSTVASLRQLLNFDSYLTSRITTLRQLHNFDNCNTSTVVKKA